MARRNGRREPRATAAASREEPIALTTARRERESPGTTHRGEKASGTCRKAAAEHHTAVSAAARLSRYQERQRGAAGRIAASAARWRLPP